MEITLASSYNKEVISLDVSKIMLIEKNHGGSYNIYYEHDGDLKSAGTGCYREITSKDKLIKAPKRTNLWSAYANDKVALISALVLDSVIEFLNMVELDYNKDDWDIRGGYFNPLMMEKITTFDTNKPVLFTFNKGWLYETEQNKIKGIEKFEERNIPIIYEPSLPKEKIRVAGMYYYKS